MRTLIVLILAGLCLLYSPAWGHEESAQTRHHGCDWWGMAGGAYGPLFSANPERHIEHEISLELALECRIETAHGEISFEPNLLVPFTLSSEFAMGIAPGFNVAWHPLHQGHVQLGPRAGFNLRGNLPIDHNGSIGLMWHAGAEAEYELVPHKLGLLLALQYAGAAMWSLGVPVEFEGALHGPELVLGLSFGL